jgi:hypothetical protein
MRKLLQLVLYMSYSAILFAQSASTSGPQTYGSIEGTVLANDGKPLEGATVYALPALNMRQQLRALTDSNGKYLIKGVPSGEAYVSVFDEDKGYPYNFFAFFINPGQEMRKVQIPVQKETTEVNFKMGDRAARLELEIVDDRGTPITNTAELAFTRPDVPGSYMTGAGDHISLLVPPVRFHLSIETPGFKQWNYENKETGGMLQPKPGETVKLTVHLVRLNNKWSRDNPGMLHTPCREPISRRDLGL